MKSTEFSALIERCALALEHRISKQATIDLWFDDCQSIPSIALPHIEAGLRLATAWPKNVPAACKDLWHEFLRLHPEKYVRTTNKECPDCLDGWLYFEHSDPAIPYKWESIIACGRCKQAHREKRFAVLDDYLNGGMVMGETLRHHLETPTGPVTRRDVKRIPF